MKRAVIASMLALASCNRNPEPSVRVAKDPDAVLPRGTPAKAAHAAVTTRTIDVDGASRKYVLVVPDSLAESPWLVLVFHGDGGTATSYHAAVPFENAAGNRAVIAYPEGIRATWDLETLDGNRDEAFTAKLIDTLTREFHVDAGHVYASGYSSGGFFANVFACHRPGVLRAIASSAGGAPYNQKEKWPNGFPGCPGQKATAMLAMHGTADFGVDLKSGKFAAQYWAYVNGCNVHQQETTAYEQCRAYLECPAQAPSVFCEIPGLGHWVWDEADVAAMSFFLRLEQRR
jgi:polyhydroxybutyrate depolymerase